MLLPWKGEDYILKILKKRFNAFSFLPDTVVRNVYYKYFHPKEALVSNGVLNRLVFLRSQNSRVEWDLEGHLV